MIPGLDTERTDGEYLPRGSKDLGNGFILLWARESDPHPLRDCEVDALCEYLGILSLGPEVPVRRWAKLRIPTGQIVIVLGKKNRNHLKSNEQHGMLKCVIGLLLIFWLIGMLLDSSK